MSRSTLPIRLIIFGEHTQSWTAALSASGAVWPLLPQITEVIRLKGDQPQAIPKPEAGVRSVLFPLMEWHILQCHRGDHDSLFPAPHAVSTLADKSLFAEHAVRNGLDAHCPARIADPSSASYPCVLKRTNLNAGQGVAIARSPVHLAELLARRPWAGFPYLLQSYEHSEFNFVTHAVCVAGRIVSHISYKQYLGEETSIRMARPVRNELYEPSAATLEIFERFLTPLAYDGPCCVDYAMRPNGDPLIFEINPRLGGSLLLSGHEPDLAKTISAVLEHAGRN